MLATPAIFWHIRACASTVGFWYARVVILRTRAHNYYGKSSRDLGAHHVVDFFKQNRLVGSDQVYAPQEGMSSV